MAVKDKTSTENVQPANTDVKETQDSPDQVAVITTPMDIKASDTVQQKRQLLKSIDSNELVPVRNVTTGRLTYISRKSGMEVRWQEYGDTEFIPFGELLTMKSSSPAFLQNPWCMIDDEQAIEVLGLKTLYESFIPVEELSSFFQLPAEVMEQKLKQSPKGTRETVSQYARTKVESGELDSVKIIKMLERELDIDLLMVQKD